MHCLHFICERKFYALTHVKITRHWKSTLWSSNSRLWGRKWALYRLFHWPFWRSCPGGSVAVVLYCIMGRFFFLSFFGLFATLRLRGRPGRDGCPSAMWDCFKGWICHHAEKASPKIVPQCTLTTISTRSPAQPQSGELSYVAYINT